MNDISNYVSILSADYLYLTIFTCLSYTLGGFINVRGIKHPDINSLTVGIPWFLVAFIFTAPTLSKATQLHIGTFVITPVLMLFLASIVYAYLKRNDPLGKFYIASAKLSLLKPLLSLSAMFILRDVVHLQIKSVVMFAILVFAFMLLTEVTKDKLDVPPSAVLYNVTALFLLGLAITIRGLGAQVLLSPACAGASLGFVSVMLYSTAKTSKVTLRDEDLDLFSRFESLVEEGQFQTAVDLTEDGLWEFQLETDTMTVSRPLQAWLCIDNNAIEHAADFWIDRVHPQDWRKLPESWIPENYEALRKKIRSLSAKNNEFEIRLKQADQSYKWVRVRFQVVAEENKTNIHGSFKDVDHEKHAKAQITQLSLFDMKTGLPNFSSMLDHLNKAIDKGTKHAIISLNIDNFKIINDLMGFFTGDEVLSKISKQLMSILPDHAHLFRFGGDEFVIISERPTEAENLAQMIQSEFDGKLSWKKTHLRITCSMGISYFPSTYASDVENILKCSDIALEYAKSNGKNQYATFDNSMMEELEQRHNLINALENSHMSENFEVHYQPLVQNAKTNAIHVEALLRWTWNDRKISPADFIPIAEETGLIIPIGKMVLDQVCRDIGLMQANGKAMHTSVNVSAIQLLHPTFIPSVKQAIEAHCIRPGQLTIEITETSLIHDIESVCRTLRTLSELGLRISLDDFGTGYSSLSHIIELPIDELKLDRTFIHNFHEDTKRQNVIKNIIQLAHGMGLKVVAEGVEVKAEADLLINYGCDVCQGYYYDYPMPLSQIRDGSIAIETEGSRIS